MPRKKKPTLTCLSIDCPERTGGQCNALEKLLAQAFPEGIAVPKTRQEHIKEFLTFARQMGFRITGYEKEHGIFEISIFVGDPFRKCGIELKYGLSVEYIANLPRRESMEAISGIVAGGIEQAWTNAERNQK